MSEKVVSRKEAVKIAKCLLEENKSGQSWRMLEKKMNVAAGTICRFAKSGGVWMPKDINILRAMGLTEERSPYGTMPRWWKRTPEALAEFLHIREKAKELSNNTRNAQKGKL